MILFQIVLGGITRLTGSGLSITKWEIVTGTLPPMSDDAWTTEFDLYKETPQFSKINRDMTLKEFKFIFFWEYFHRLWARSIGFVFLIPFLLFLRKKMLSKGLVKKLITAVLLGAIVASFGWVMVKSGLIDRPWVNAYKLVLHLGLGVLLFTYLLYIGADYWLKHHKISGPFLIRKNALTVLIVLVFVQVLLGGLMSGMRAGLFYPTWPLIGTEWIPAQLFEWNNWSLERFTMYDKDAFAPAVIHFFHRSMAYLLIVLYLFIYLKDKSNPYLRKGFILLFLQIVLGIVTVIKCIGEIPVLWGGLHQLVGILFFGYLVYIYLVKIRIEKSI
jgi:cytochrome c oxidase assembly protein subunit 15